MGFRSLLCTLCTQALKTGSAAPQQLVGDVKGAVLFETLSQECFGIHLKAATKKVRYHRLVPETLFKASVQSSFLLAVRWWFVFVFVFLILVFREAIFSISHIILWFRDLLKKSLLSRKVKKRSEERTYFAQIARSSAIHHFYTWKSLWKVSQCFFGINNCCAGLSFLHCLVSFAVWWGSCSVCSFFSRGMSALQVQWHCIFYGSMRCWQ